MGKGGENKITNTELLKIHNSYYTLTDMGNI